MKFNNTIPGHTKNTLVHYLKLGWEPGGFVSSMLAMDMERALTTADVVNRHHIYDIGAWILANAPEGSWGNYELIKAWCEDRDGRRTRWAMWYELNKTDEVEEPLF